MKCPKCGSLNIAVDGDNYKCNNCGNLIPINNVPKTNPILNSINEYQKSQEVYKNTMGGVQNNNPIISYKCPKCGYSIVKDSSITSPICPFCHNTLTISDRTVEGGAPSFILPFTLTIEDAKKKIEEYVKDKKLFSDKEFSNIDVNNISAVYFPYLVSDIKCHANYKGNGEIGVSSDTKNGKTLYIADLYSVERDFDLDIKGISLSNISTLNMIGPFNTSNLLPWKSGYLTGYTGVLNTLKKDEFKDQIEKYSHDLALSSSYDTTKNMYDRGVVWNDNNFNIISSSSNFCYLPVYLYSVKVGNQVSFVCCNGTNGNTSGDINISTSKIIILASIVFILCIIFRQISTFLSTITLILGIAFIIYIIYKYKGNPLNSKVSDNGHIVSNLVQHDTLIKREENLEDSHIDNFSPFADNLSSKIKSVLKFRK